MEFLIVIVMNLKVNRHKWLVLPYWTAQTKIIIKILWQINPFYFIYLLFVVMVRNIKSVAHLTFLTLTSSLYISFTPLH